MESFECMGYWWLPDEPEKKVPGKLSFDPATGGLLELLGDFGDATPFGGTVGKRFEIINGYVNEKYAYVTLLGCIVSFWMDNIFTEIKLEFTCILRTMRLWFTTPEEIQFEKMVVGYTYLNDWMRQRNFEIDYTHHNYKSLETARAKYVKPESIEVALEKAKISFRATLKDSSQSIAEVSWKDIHRITITPEDKLHFDKYFPFINSLRDFFTLATGHTNYPLDIVGVRSDAPGGILIYYQILGYTETQNQLIPWHMLFAYQDVKDDFPKYLANWIGKADKLQSVYDLYFDTYYQKALVLQTEFLDLARALEAYHRNVCGGEYRSKEEYEPIKNALIEAIPDCVEKPHRDKLIGMLNYGNEFSLRTRLKRICNETLNDYEDIKKELLGKPDDFIHTLVEVRNALTHADKLPDEDELFGVELYNYTRQMKMLLRICFLVAMEFPPDDIKQLLHNNQEYQQMYQNKI